MNTTERDARLRNFFSAYFNQDWMVEGAATWDEVVRQYLQENGETASRMLQEALVQWMDESKLEEVQSLPPSVGCDFDSSFIGLSERQWVGELVAELDRLLSLEAGA